MSYLEDNRDELMEEADNRKRDIAEGWVPPHEKSIVEEMSEITTMTENLMRTMGIPENKIYKLNRSKPGIEEGSLEDVNPDIEEIPPMTELFY